MEYEEICLLKQSEISTVRLVREPGGERELVQKIRKGHYDIYSVLKDCSHPYLPKLYEVTFTDEETVILEEYIPGGSLGSVSLTEKQIITAFKELCTVLEFLHGKGIIHRDVKPSNILLGEDGHIRLIDFDAARMPKDDLDQDTRLLGTRGYAPPEQYGFAQTDARADIYALGVTLKQLLGEKAQLPRYSRIIAKCTNLNPDERYQTAREVKQALSAGNRRLAIGAGAAVLCALLVWMILPRQPVPAPEPEPQPVVSQPVASQPEEAPTEEFPVDENGLKILPAPEAPHWDGETGIAIWGNVPESGTDGSVQYNWRLYCRQNETSIDPETDENFYRGGARGNGGINAYDSTYSDNLASAFRVNGVYYFAVQAVGDGVQYANSPFVVSDAFIFTGENAPELPKPVGLEYREFDNGAGMHSYITWSNLDDYADLDAFYIWVYDQAGETVAQNNWTKEMMVSRDGCMQLNKQKVTKEGGPYRFQVQAISSRPNEYTSNPKPDPSDESAYSPWFEVTFEPET